MGARRRELLDPDGEDDDYELYSRAWLRRHASAIMGRKIFRRVENVQVDWKKLGRCTCDESMLDYQGCICGANGWTVHSASKKCPQCGKDMKDCECYE